jgi:hypothetical protein
MPNTIYRNEIGKNINKKFLLQKITKWSYMKKRDKIFLKNSIRKILACKKNMVDPALVWPFVKG